MYQVKAKYTVAMLRAKAKELGLYYRRDSWWNEHQVNLKKEDGGTPESKYHTTDPEDAWFTMDHMVAYKSMVIAQEGRSR